MLNLKHQQLENLELCIWRSIHCVRCASQALSLTNREKLKLCRHWYVRDWTAHIHACIRQLSGKMRRRQINVCKIMRKKTLCTVKMWSVWHGPCTELDFICHRNYMSFICFWVSQAACAKHVLVYGKHKIGHEYNILPVYICMWDNTFCLSSILHTR